MDRFDLTRPRFIEGRSSFGRMLMLERDQDYINQGGFRSSDGFMDWEMAAKAGVRIYLFVTSDYLGRNPKCHSFICGTWDDLDAIIGGGKVHVEKRGNCMMNPLQNVWPSQLNLGASPHLAVAMVTAEEFHRAFGPKRFTSIFPKEV